MPPLSLYVYIYIACSLEDCSYARTKKQFTTKRAYDLILVGHFWLVYSSFQHAVPCVLEHSLLREIHAFPHG